MEDLSSFKICPDYKRESFDFCEIKKDKNNKIARNGELLYPFLLPSSHGTSYTLKISDNLFFKRKQQDGNLPAQIFSQHHFNKNYSELSGSLDDLSEVICYYLAKNLIDPKTQKPLVEVAKYKLANYTDEEGIEFRGCVTENVASENEELISMADIIKSTGIDSLNQEKSIDFYMNQINKTAKQRYIKIDEQKIARDLLKNSYFCWKVANSDNHKNNITFLLRKNEKGERELVVSPLIDNGSAYELSAPYVTALEPSVPRFAKLLEDENFSKIDENGKKVFDFAYYPFMHNAFMIDTNDINVENIKIGEKIFSYEYGLAAKMLSDNELMRQIYQIENQFDIEKMFDEIDKDYGTFNGFNWPPMLKDFIRATNKVKSQTLSYITADLYFQNAVKASGLKQNFNLFKDKFLNIPLMQSKEKYDTLFSEFCETFGTKIDRDKLKNMSVYKNAPQNQMQ